MPFAPGAASSPLSEEQFAACLAGDSQAWERLLKLSSPIITAIARTDFGLHREDVEDVVQMVHLKLYEHLSALRDPASFGCWLRRMTRHIIIDMLRQKRQTVSLEALVEDTGLEPTLPAGSQPEDSDGVIATRLDLRRALASLPPLYREPVVYYLLQGKAQDEIGNLLGRPRSTVATQIQRGLARLRRSLGAGYEDGRMTA
jgi:RNA polymerase sigma-70 factor (ECF subfamily)